MDEETKKKWLYGAGAVASIGALVIYMKNRSGGAQSVSVPTSSPGVAGSSGSNAAEAARINAATQLSIAEGNQGLQKQALAAQYGIAMAQISGAENVARIQANSKTANAALGPGGAASLAAPGAVKVAGDIGTGLIDLIGNAIKGIFGGGSPGVANAGKPDPNAPNPFLDPEKGSPYYSSFLNPFTYSSTGNILDSDNPGADYYQGSIGGGSSDWFGSSPVDFVGPLPSEGSGGYNSAAPGSEFDFTDNYIPSNPAGDSAPGTEF